MSKNIWKTNVVKVSARLNVDQIIAQKFNTYGKLLMDGLKPLKNHTKSAYKY